MKSCHEGICVQRSKFTINGDYQCSMGKMDRCFALPAYQEKPFVGKPIAIAMTCGGEYPFDSGCVNALMTFQDAFGYIESKIVGMVYGSAMDAGQILSNKKAMKEAFDLGKKLASE